MINLSALTASDLRSASAALARTASATSLPPRVAAALGTLAGDLAELARQRPEATDAGLEIRIAVTDLGAAAGDARDRTERAAMVAIQMLLARLDGDPVRVLATATSDPRAALAGLLGVAQRFGMRLCGDDEHRYRAALHEMAVIAELDGVERQPEAPGRPG